MVNELEPSYIDSFILNFRVVEILSQDLLLAIEELKKESSQFKPFQKISEYQEYVYLTTQLIDGVEFIRLHTTHNYMGAFAFPGAENVDPLHYAKYPNITSITGVAFVDDLPIIISTKFMAWVQNSKSDDLNLITINEESTTLSIYGIRGKESNKWIYSLEPSVTLFCEVVDDKLVLSKFNYDDGSLKFTD